MKYFITSVFLLFSIFQLQSQEAVFSQFYLSPLNLNPALAGAECGDQLIVNYRDQWRSILKSAAYRTGSFSYDRPFLLKNGDRIGVGARFLVDRAGTFNFQTINATASFSYQKKVFKSEKNTHFLIGGMEAGWGQRSNDFRQEVIIAEDPTVFEGLKIKGNYAELGFGLNYRITSESGKEWDAGFAAFHANQPENLPVRYIFHASGDIPVSARFDIRPRIIYTTQSSAEKLIANLGFRFFLNEKTTHSLELSAGGNFNDINSLLISAAYFYKNIGFSVLTEFNGEELNRGGIDSYEGALIYRFCK